MLPLYPPSALFHPFSGDCHRHIRSRAEHNTTTTYCLYVQAQFVPPLLSFQLSAGTITRTCYFIIRLGGRVRRSPFTHQQKIGQDGEVEGGMGAVG